MGRSDGTLALVLPGKRGHGSAAATAARISRSPWLCVTFRMLRSALRTLRYARSWKNGSTMSLHEIEIERDGMSLPATFILPTSDQGSLLGWIVLGGVTRMGRFHPQLARFTHALAESGVCVIAPEIPEWRDLRLESRVTVPTVRAAVHALDARSDVRPGKFGLVGVSFGAPQAAITANHEELSERIGCVVSFGGYCDLQRTLRCQLTGLHEWEGVTRRIDPDPYGRWVLASNYLTEVPGCEDAADVAAALRRLALASTEQRLPRGMRAMTCSSASSGSAWRRAGRRSSTCSRRSPHRR